MHQGSCGDSVAIWWASGCDGNIPPGPESCIDDRVCVAWLLKLYDIFFSEEFELQNPEDPIRWLNNIGCNIS